MEDKHEKVTVAVVRIGSRQTWWDGWLAGALVGSVVELLVLLLIGWRP